MSSVIVLVALTEHPEGIIEYPDATAMLLPNDTLVVARGVHILAEFPQERYLSWSLEGSPEPGPEPGPDPEPGPAPEPDPEPESPPPGA